MGGTAAFALWLNRSRVRWPIRGNFRVKVQRKVPTKMTSHGVQDAVDLAAFAGRVLERLSEAEARFDGLTEVERERAWLASASERVRTSLALTHGALLEAAPLPELEGPRKPKSQALSSAWADAVERLFDAIVANVSANGPLVEALFPHQRFAVLRRGGAAARNFWLEFERRAESAYVRRLCLDPEYHFLSPLLESARLAERSLTEFLSPRPLPEAEALELRRQLSAASEKLELALKQARSLVDAACAATPELISELGLDAKPKRRAPRAREGAPEEAVN
jgi:hypothetical protein